MKTVITIEDCADGDGLGQVSLKMELEAEPETIAELGEPTPAMWVAATISSTFKTGELLARTQRFIKSAEGIEGTAEGQKILDQQTQEGLAAGLAYTAENAKKAEELRAGLAAIKSGEPVKED